MHQCFEQKAPLIHSANQIQEPELLYYWSRVNVVLSLHLHCPSVVSLAGAWPDVA